MVQRRDGVKDEDMEEMIPHWISTAFSTSINGYGIRLIFR
jgi:hypothetical protein